jgi:hypothetical protein
MRLWAYCAEGSEGIMCRKESSCNSEREKRLKQGVRVKSLEFLVENFT